MESPASRINWLLRIPASNFRAPNYIQLESTTKCNLKCKTCIRSSENFDMNFDFFKSIVNQLQPGKFGTQQVDLTGVGEPLLNKNIVSMVAYAKKRGFRTGFASNFTLMDAAKAEQLIRAGMDYLYISIDSATKETFEKLRSGAIFEDVISRVKLFVKKRKELACHRPLLKLTVTLSKDNKNEIPDLIKLAETLEMDSVNFNSEILPINEHYKSGVNEVIALPMWKTGLRSEISIDRKAVWLRKTHPCMAMKGLYVTYDGLVLPCNGLMQLISRAKYGDTKVGDLKRNTVKEVWCSTDYRKLRTMLALGLVSDFCRFCPRPYQI